MRGHEGRLSRSFEHRQRFRCNVNWSEMDGEDTQNDGPIWSGNLLVLSALSLGVGVALIVTSERLNFGREEAEFLLKAVGTMFLGSCLMFAGLHALARLWREHEIWRRELDTDPRQSLPDQKPIQDL